MSYFTFHTKYREAHDILYRISYRAGRLRDSLFTYWYYRSSYIDLSEKIGDYKNSFPVIISNFNRLSSLEKMIEWLLIVEDVKIIILDNGSSRKDLLKYYKTIQSDRIKILYLPNYKDFRALNAVARIIRKQVDYYVITDSDLDPNNVNAKDLLDRSKYILNKEQMVNHVGPSLAIDDLNRNLPMERMIYDVEINNWSDEIVGVGFKASIDTTFAVYRNSSKPLMSKNAIRLHPPYVLRHPDWYESNRKLDDYSLSKRIANAKSSLASVDKYLATNSGLE